MGLSSAPAGCRLITNALTLAIAACASVSLCLAKAPVDEIVFHGDCDASTAIAVSENTFFVIGDEAKPKARLYNTSGTLLDDTSLKGFLSTGTEDLEPDLEASARLKDTVFVMGSHGRDDDGTVRPERNQFFAFKFSMEQGKLQLNQVGKTISGLHEQILTSFSTLKLDTDPKHNHEELAPKKGTSINIEGLAADPGKDNLLIGLRSPLTSKKEAIVLRLDNPFKLVKGEEPNATFGPSSFLDLNGEGIRSMEFWPENHCFLIVSGNCGEDRGFSVYRWSGDASDKKPKELISMRQEKIFNPEAIVLFPGNAKRFLLLSDDGAQKIDGIKCKKLDKSKRRFTGHWFNFK